ncbi:MAG: sensor histidine kinase [Alkalispirochaeta sp.]
MRIHPGVVLLSLALSVASPLALFSTYDTPTTRVLILHSYSTDFQWTRDLDGGIRDVLQGDPRTYSVVFSEYLNGKTHFDDEYLQGVARHLGDKYRDYQFDALVVTDNLGLEFLREYRDQLFGEVPTVFAGINDYEPALTEGLSNITGVPEQVTIEETLFKAFELLPGNRLVVLGDGTLTYWRNEGILRRALERIDHTRRVEIYPEITLSQVERLSARIEPTDVVFLAASVLEEDGTVADFRRAGTVVSSLMPVPVFAMWDFFMGTGVAGGFLLSGYEHGTAAAEIALNILQGASADEIAVHDGSPNRWIFDMEPLRAAGIDRDQLPPEAIIYNDDPSLWEQYTTELSWLVALLTVMGALIVLLIESRRNRAIAAQNLQESLSEKEILLKEIHHRVKNNLQVISSILNIQSTFVSDHRSLDYFKDCETRVQSMALVHEQLYQNETLARIHLPTYLEELLASVYGAMVKDADTVIVRREVADLSLHLDQAIPVGLMVNELVSNAVKYAYPVPAMRPGEILLRVLQTDTEVEISVRDWGVGLGDSKHHTDSLGLQLVDALTSQLHGTVQFEASNPGLLVRLRFPWEEEV